MGGRVWVGLCGADLCRPSNPLRPFFFFTAAVFIPPPHSCLGRTSTPHLPVSVVILTFTPWRLRVEPTAKKLKHIVLPSIPQPYPPPSKTLNKKPRITVSRCPPQPTPPSPESPVSLRNFSGGSTPIPFTTPCPQHNKGTTTGTGASLERTPLGGEGGHRARSTSFPPRKPAHSGKKRSRTEEGGWKAETHKKRQDVGHGGLLRERRG